MTRSPLLASAMAQLEREAETNPDAARLLAILEELAPWGRWGQLEALNHFTAERPMPARSVLLAVLLHELAAACPVQKSLLQ